MLADGAFHKIPCGRQKLSVYDSMVRLNRQSFSVLRAFFLCGLHFAMLVG